MKQTEEDFIERLKAWLVANGLRQVEGVEYKQTFSPVVKAVPISLVLTFAITRKMTIGSSGHLEYVSTW